MTVEDVDKIDFVNIGAEPGDAVLTVSDHLDWDENEGEHLFVLQDKLNTYLEFIEGGHLYDKFPRARGRRIVVQVFGKFPLSVEAKKFYDLASTTFGDLGYSLHFRYRPELRWIKYPCPLRAKVPAAGWLAPESAAPGAGDLMPPFFLIEVPMSILQCDEDALSRQLEKLPSQLRVAFAAACAERQMPNYFRFTKATGRGTPECLVRALCDLWDEIEGRSVAESELRAQLDLCLRLFPEEEQGDSGRLGYIAEDAVATVAYAIRARLESGVQDVIWASRRACEALDAYTGAGATPTFHGREAARRLSNPLLQAELRRQKADLTQLQEIAAGSLNEKAGIAGVRSRAQADAKVFLGPESS
jgi:uncharacterized protein YjaG (DUF416 family)